MADVTRLVNVAIVPEAAKEIANQIDSATGELVAGVATVATPDATDEATAVTLVNALKARLNQLITALKA
jgi:hypothetical protein